VTGDRPASAPPDEVDFVSGRTRVYGIVGDPIEQVRSPEMITAEFVRRGIDALMIPVHVRPADFDACLAQLKRVQNLDGLVFTIPYKRTAVALAEDRSIGVEQDVNAAILEVPDHSRQVCDQHWFADAMQDCPRKAGDLVDNRREEVPAHVGWRLELLVGARASGAQEIAAVCHFQIKADRRSGGYFGALTRDRLVIAARIERRLSDRHFAGRTHCDDPASAVRCIRVRQVVNAQARMRPPNRIDFVTILGM